MPTSFFLLMRFFLRVDGVLIRINDTRLYHEVSCFITWECAARFHHGQVKDLKVTHVMQRLVSGWEGLHAARVHYEGKQNLRAEGEQWHRAVILGFYNVILLFISTYWFLRSKAEPEYFHVHERLCVSLNVVWHFILAQTHFGFVNNCICSWDEMFTEMFVFVQRRTLYLKIQLIKKSVAGTHQISVGLDI